MHHALVNSVGQSLLSVSLYAVAFESLVLTIRTRMFTYLARNDNDSLPAFADSLRSSGKTLEFCESRLVNMGMLAQSEVDSLAAIRARRNNLVHEEGNAAFSLSVNEIQNDISCIFQIVRRVEKWHEGDGAQDPNSTSSFAATPSLVAMYLQVAKELAPILKVTPISATLKS